MAALKGSLASNCSFILNFAYFSLAVLSGWALKQVNSRAFYTFVAFIMLLLQGITGIGINSQPHAGKSLRKLSANITVYTHLFAIVLNVIDTLALVGVHKVVNLLPKIFILICVIIFITHCLQWHRLQSYISSLIVILSATALSYYVLLSFSECYWTGGLVFVLFINHFILQHIAKRYDIPQIEVQVIGMCFFVLFALNAINEIASTTVT